MPSFSPELAEAPPRRGHAFRASSRPLVSSDCASENVSRRDLPLPKLAFSCGRGSTHHRVYVSVLPTLYSLRFLQPDFEKCCCSLCVSRAAVSPLASAVLVRLRELGRCKSFLSPLLCSVLGLVFMRLGDFLIGNRSMSWQLCVCLGFRLQTCRESAFLPRACLLSQPRSTAR